jgi:hypothetical protein
MKDKRRESPVELWEDLSRELWEVKHGVAAPRLMTLDELDAAFKNDEIDAHTLVRKAGTTQFRTLGDVAGLPPPSTITLESESLMPVTSEIEVSAAKKPSPPPLPRKSRDEIEADTPKPVPRRSDDDIRISERDALRSKKSRSTMDVMSDEIELRSSDIDVVKLDLGKEKETSTVKQPAARLREEPFTREDEEMKAVRPRSMAGRLVAVAAVALVGGGVFAGVSAWLAGTFGPSSTHAPRAPAVEAPAQPANEEAPPPSTAPITSSEGSMLVLAQGQTASAPEKEKENESAKTETTKADEAKPEPKAAAAPAKAAPAKAVAPTPLATAAKKPGQAPAAHAPGKPKLAQAGPRVASTPGPAPAKASAHAALPTFRGDKKGGDAKVPPSKKAKVK